MKNNVLAFLVVVFIFLSLAGFLAFPGGVVEITGFAGSGISSAAFNITEEVSVLVSGNVDFGAGRVNPDASEAILQSFEGYVFYSWVNVSQPVSRPSGRFGQVVYHEVWDVFVFYGGLFNESVAETWLYNYSDNSWSELSTSSIPVATRSFGMVYDSSSGGVVLYGGMLNDSFDSGVLNGTWVLNSSREWENVFPASSPPALVWPAMAFDSSRNVTVLFGGHAEDEFVNETWEFNSSSESWVNVTPSGESPHFRVGAAIAFDSGRNVSVLSGGYYLPSGGGGSFFNDTWEFDGSSWTDITGSVSGEPTGTRGASMVYDPKRDRMVLLDGDYIVGSSGNLVQSPKCAGIAGDLNYDGYVNETDNDIIEEMILGQTDPSYCADMNADGSISPTDSSIHNSLITQGEFNFYDRVWEFNTTDWFLTSREVLGDRRADLVWDSEDNKTFLFYGTGFEEDYLYNDVWWYNGSDFSTDAGFDACINGTWLFSKSFFTIENDGTVNISVNFSADKNAGQFIGGTSPEFKIKGAVNESGACPALVTSFTEVPNSSETPQNICPLLNFGNPADDFIVPVKLVVPGDVSAGSKNATITFAASKV